MRDFGLIVGVMLVAGCMFIASTMLAASSPLAIYLPLGLIACGFVAWLMLAAIFGSPVAIIIYFSAVVFLTEAQFRVRDAGDITTDWQSALKFLVWLGAGVIGFAHIRSPRLLLARPATTCWMVYIAVALASSVYSPIAGYSFGCAVALLCLFAFSFSLTTHLSEGQILWTLLLTLTVFNVGGWGVFYAMPELGTSEAVTITGVVMLRMCGLAGQANNLGAICATAVGTAFVLWYTRRSGLFLSLILGGFAFATLVQSDSRTTEIASIAGIVAVLALRSVWLMAGGALSGFVGVLLLQVFPGLTSALGSQFSRSGDPTEIFTLTGRLEIWDFVWQKITLSPILGFGYNSAKDVLGSHIGFENGLMVDSAHNLYLQNLLSVGALGTIPLVIVLIYLTYRGFTRPIPIICYMMVVTLISSISDAETIGTTPTVSTVIIFLMSVWPGLELAPRVDVRQSRELVISR